MTEIANPESHSFQSNRLRLHYVDWGNSEAPPLLLVHGGRDHCRSWDWLARDLSKRFRVLALDLRGHGDSDWLNGGAYQLSDYLYDIAQFISQLDLSPLRIIGHSLGGAIAARYAGLYPENVVRLVNIEGFGQSPDQVAKALATPVEESLRDWVSDNQQMAARKPRTYESLAAAIERMGSAHPRLTLEQVTHLTRYGARAVNGGFQWKFDPYVRIPPATTFTPAENERLYARICCPVLMIRGLDSWSSNPAVDGRSDPYQDVRVVQVADAGHWVHHDQLPVVVKELDNFL